MKTPAFAEKTFGRFDQLSLRERAIVALALIVMLVMAWDAALMQPMQQREASMRQEMQTMQETSLALQGAEPAQGPDPTTQALDQERALQAALAAVNTKLASTAAGLIPPERMVEMLHDVLSRQRDVRLVSLRNKPVTGLAPPSKPGDPLTGPYVHPIELTVEGPYLDVLAYLQALEALPWRLYWKVIEIDARERPVSRARIELSTLSMDKEWLGV